MELVSLLRGDPATLLHRGRQCACGALGRRVSICQRSRENVTDELEVR
jgi:hypothetical protein